MDFLYTPEGQGIWPSRLPPGGRGRARSSRTTSRRPKKLWTIDDLGGWGKVNDELFDPETGSVAKIYDEATG